MKSWGGGLIGFFYYLQVWKTATYFDILNFFLPWMECKLFHFLFDKKSLPSLHTEEKALEISSRVVGEGPCEIHMYMGLRQFICGTCP